MNWSNYDDVLGQLRSAGLQVDTIDVGTRRRCKIEGDREKRGWYHLHELHTDRGDTLLVGTYGVWRGNDPGTQKVALKGNPLSDAQRQALKARIEEDRKRDEARRKREAARAAQAAAAMWERLQPAGACDYLTRKQVKPFGVRFSPQGAMAIPLLDAAGTVHGLQLIYPKGHPRATRLGRDKDFWPTGLVKQGNFFLIGSPTVSPVLLVAEGYATAASLHMAIGLPVAVAFDAGNLLHVCQALHKRYRGVKLLVCADDDYLGKCRECGELTSTAAETCSHCGKPARVQNAGHRGAEAAALAVGGDWMTPVFRARPNDRKGPTDFNDLHCAEGLHIVRTQVEGRLSVLGWKVAGANARGATPEGEGVDDDGERGDLQVLTTVGQLVRRFSIVYEMSETVFDGREHKLVPLGSMRNLCSSRQLHRSWMESTEKRIVRVSEVGFDPTERDPRVKCNLWGGWPTTPRAGDCSKLLQLLEYLCSDDVRGSELYQWVLRWLALPVQRPGCKMKTALVLHGPQGTGKNLFFEAYMGIYGEYARVIDQEAIEDKFNDCLSRKLFVVADEVVARQELYHTKNKLKGLVTGTEIRINPKNVGSYFETNHLNLVFLSNEPQPMVLERDDRRYCVIWTPPKLDPAFYNEVLAEIDAGGVEALHHYLLHLDLGDFGPATLPPTTTAKQELIELSLDSSERFWNEWLRKELPLPVTATRTEDLYAAYRHWCVAQGVAKPAQLSTFVGSLSKRPGARKERARHFKNRSRTVQAQSTVLYPPGADVGLDMDALSDHLATFSEAVHIWRNPAKDGAQRPAYAEEDGF